jgi:hypothetical protein
MDFALPIENKKLSYAINFPLPVDALNVSFTNAAVDGIWNFQRTTLTRREINVLVRMKFPNQISSNTRNTHKCINSTTIYEALQKNGFGKSNA